MTYPTTRSPNAARTVSNSVRRDHLQPAAVLFCLLFFLEGLIFIPYLGLQNDEVLFAGAIFPPWGVLHAIRFAGHTFPTMILSYVGTFKAWIYRLFLFSLWPPTPWTVRLPVVVIGAITIWLFYEFARKTAGARAALVATALLATDATYVLTTCLDWGPVALQHLLLMAGALSLWSFHRSGKLLFLGGGFFAFGLGLWDKALFAWSLAGLAAATAVLFPRALASKLSPRNVAIAVAALAAGAAPLIVYNHDQGLATIHERPPLSSARFDHKLLVLRNSLEGSALFGYVVRDEPALQFHQSDDPLELLSLGLSEAVGGTHTGLLSLACILAFTLLPWVWNTPARKPMLFALIFCAVTWLQMALTQKGGGGAHHSVLLWPFPHLFVAAAFAQASRWLPRTGLIALVLATTIVCGSNLIVLNEYLARLVERGTTTIWTDAIYGLSQGLGDAAASQVYITDWGILDALRALNRGKLPLRLAEDWFLLSNEKKLPASELAGRNAIFVGHTDGNEVKPAITVQLETLAESVGLRKHVLRVVQDRNGRPIFEVYRYTRAVPK